MRWKHNEESNEYRCCLCCHVRTGTIFLGLLSLLAQIMMLSMFAVVILHPELIQREEVVLEAQLATDTSTNQKSTEQQLKIAEEEAELKLEQQFFGDEYTNNKHHHMRAFGDNTEDDRFVCMLLVMSVFFATILLVYGAVKGVPGYLMPFFCIQVFSFCIFCLTVLSYFSSAPDIKKMVAMQKEFPFKDELLKMDNDLLTLLSVVVAVLMLSVKAYFIGIVWSCYKYLTALNRGQIARSYETHPNPEDSEMLLPPKYEDAIRMDPADMYPANPPPPYSTN